MVSTPNKDLVEKGRTFSIDQAVQRGGRFSEEVMCRPSSHHVRGQRGLHLDVLR